MEITTTYDAAGRPTEVEYPESMTVRNTYNAAGLLDEVELDHGTGSGYATVVDQTEYNARGQLTSLTHGNGVQTTREYDPDLERPTRIFTQHVDTSTTHFQDLAYNYDPVGNPVQLTDRLRHSTFKANQLIPNTRQFWYDAALPPGAGPRPQARHDHRQVHERDRELAGPERLRPLRLPLRLRRGRQLHEEPGVRTRGRLLQGEPHRPVQRRQGRGDRRRLPTAGNFRYDDNGNTTKTPRIDELAYTHDNQARYVDLGGGGEVRYLRHGDQRVVRLGQQDRREGAGDLPRAVRVPAADGDDELHEAGPARERARPPCTGRGGAGRVSDPDSLDVLLQPRRPPRQRARAHQGRRDAAEPGGVLPVWEGSDRRDARNRYRYIGVERDEDTKLCA